MAVVRARGPHDTCINLGGLVLDPDTGAGSCDPGRRGNNVSTIAWPSMIPMLQKHQTPTSNKNDKNNLR